MITQVWETECKDYLIGSSCTFSTDKMDKWNGLCAYGSNGGCCSAYPNGFKLVNEEKESC